MNRFYVYTVINCYDKSYTGLLVVIIRFISLRMVFIRLNRLKQKKCILNASKFYEDISILTVM